MWAVPASVLLAWAVPASVVLALVVLALVALAMVVSEKATAGLVLEMAYGKLRHKRSDLGTPLDVLDR